MAKRKAQTSTKPRSATKTRSKVKRTEPTAHNTRANSTGAAECEVPPLRQSQVRSRSVQIDHVSGRSAILHKKVQGRLSKETSGRGEPTKIRANAL